MTKATTDTRAPLVKTIEIDAPADALWDAISTAEGVSRWFTFKTRVKPGVGGEIWGEWAPGDGGTMRFDAWEPGRRLRIVEDTMMPDLPQFMEYAIEANTGGGSVLRLTHSGIGADTKWDEMYDSVNRGWDVFMETLKLSLERHPGRDRVVGYAACRPSVPRAEAWDRLIGPEGLAIERTSEGGDDFGTFSVNAGPARLSGRSWIWNPPKDLAGVVGDLEDAALWIAIEQFGERPNVSMTLSSYAAPEAAVRDAESQWQAMLDRLFPESS